MEKQRGEAERGTFQKSLAARERTTAWRKSSSGRCEEKIGKRGGAKGGQDFPGSFGVLSQDVSRASARSGANLSDKTADGPLANPLGGGETVPQGRMGGRWRGGKGPWRIKEEQTERENEGRPPGRFRGVQLIGASATAATPAPLADPDVG